jgi:hypothetical protein
MEPSTHGTKQTFCERVPMSAFCEANAQRPSHSVIINAAPNLHYLVPNIDLDSEINAVLERCRPAGLRNGNDP